MFKGKWFEQTSTNKNQSLRDNQHAINDLKRTTEIQLIIDPEEIIDDPKDEIAKQMRTKITKIIAEKEILLNLLDAFLK